MVSNSRARARAAAIAEEQRAVVTSDQVRAAQRKGMRPEVLVDNVRRLGYVIAGAAIGQNFGFDLKRPPMSGAILAAWLLGEEVSLGLPLERRNRVRFEQINPITAANAHRARATLLYPLLDRGLGAMQGLLDYCNLPKPIIMGRFGNWPTPRIVTSSETRDVAILQAKQGISTALGLASSHIFLREKDELMELLRQPETLWELGQQTSALMVSPALLLFSQPLSIEEFKGACSEEELEGACSDEETVADLVTNSDEWFIRQVAALNKGNSPVVGRVFDDKAEGGLARSAVSRSLPSGDELMITGVHYHDDPQVPVTRCNLIVSQPNRSAIYYVPLPQHHPLDATALRLAPMIARASRERLRHEGLLPPRKSGDPTNRMGANLPEGWDETNADLIQRRRPRHVSGLLTPEELQELRPVYVIGKDRRVKTVMTRRGKVVSNSRYKTSFPRAAHIRKIRLSSSDLRSLGISPKPECVYTRTVPVAEAIVNGPRVERDDIVALLQATGRPFFLRKTTDDGTVLFGGEILEHSFDKGGVEMVRVIGEVPDSFMGTRIHDATPDRYGLNLEMVQ